MCYLCEITCINRVKNLIKETVKQFGAIDILLINDAGKNPERLSVIEDVTENEWD